MRPRRSNPSRSHCASAVTSGFGTRLSGQQDDCPESIEIGFVERVLWRRLGRQERRLVAFARGTAAVHMEDFFHPIPPLRGPSRRKEARRTTMIAVSDLVVVITFVVRWGTIVFSGMLVPVRVRFAPMLVGVRMVGPVRPISGTRASGRPARDVCETDARNHAQDDRQTLHPESISARPLGNKYLVRNARSADGARSTYAEVPVVCRNRYTSGTVTLRFLVSSTLSCGASFRSRQREGSLTARKTGHARGHLA